MKEIRIQVHDYSPWGPYSIVEDRTATPEEVHELKERALKSITVDWGRLPKEATHIVYYAELLDRKGEVWFAGIYMKGEAYADAEFERIFQRPEVGYVGAIHKRV